MKYLAEVCLAVSALVAVTTFPVAAQSPLPVANTYPAAPPLQKGISVHLPITAHATAMPDADKPEAWIVAVTQDARVYVGMNPVSVSALAKTIQAALANREEKNLYLKADARIPYADLVKVLEGLRAGGATSINLITAQPDLPHSGFPVPPRSLPVRLQTQSLSGQSAAVVRLNPSRQVTIDDKPVTALESRLKQRFANESAKLVRVQANGTLPFADVAKVIDQCRSSGAEVMLVTRAIDRK
jgi:biopolymer transport protein TolR